jgi:competence ComEA-like helix-hairpin-helix protein
MNAIQALNPTFPIAELSLNGECGYYIQNGKITLTIAEMANNRDWDNISGTLAIELWALPQAYHGGDFNGEALAGVCVGELYGQHYLANSLYELDFQEPSEGQWQLVLMLREWTGLGYQTVDYLNFAVPYIVSNKPVVIRNDDSNIISVNFNDTKKTSAKKARTTQAKTAKTKPAAVESAAVSLNQADLQELVAVKGVSKKLAETLVDARPFESFDEVLKVKGMGAKLLEKIRAFITL